MLLRYCQEGGYLVGTSHPIGASIDARWGPGSPLFGCSELRCARCQAHVQSSAPPGRSIRTYSCSCHRLEVTWAAPAPDPDPYAIEDATTPWRCGGHGPLTLPITLDGLTIPVRPDWRVVIAAALDRSEHLHPALHDVGGFAAVRLLVAAEPPDRASILEAILEATASPDPKRRARALRVLAMAPREPGLEPFLAEAALNPSSFDADDPDVPGTPLSRWVTLLAASRIEPDPEGTVHDQAALQLLRALATRCPGIGGSIYPLAWADPTWVLAHIPAILDAGSPDTWERLLIAFKSSEASAHDLVGQLLARGVPPSEIRERARVSVGGFRGEAGVEQALAEPVVAWFREAVTGGLPGDAPPSGVLGRTWDADPSGQPTLVRAARDLLREGDDAVRSEILGFLRLRGGPALPLIRELITEPPAWIDHTDPQEPGNHLGRRILRAALADLTREEPAIAGTCEPWVAQYEAHEEWLSYWLDADPKGRALTVLANDIAVGRDLSRLAASIGIVYASFARDELLRAADLLTGANLDVRARFVAEVDRYLPATDAALKRDVHDRLGL